MLRIHFTVDDLARTRVADGPDVMWEIALSVYQLQSRAGAAVFGPWRGRARHRLGNWATPLATLMPHRDYFPDFLTPNCGEGDVEIGIASVLSTSSSQLESEFARLGSTAKLPSWVGGLADGDSQSLTRLGAILRRYHHEVIAQDWPMIDALVRADRADRTRTLLAGGLEEMLDHVGPAVRWRPPVLQCAFSCDLDIYLNGRGLVLVPSFFCWPRPTTVLYPQLQPVLVFPIKHLDRAAGGAQGPDGGRRLAALIGDTRAAILRSIEAGCSTTELAARAGVSVGSASQHATVLRQAGLVSTQRVGGSVIHTLTDLGTTLLRPSPSA